MSKKAHDSRTVEREDSDSTPMLAASSPGGGGAGEPAAGAAAEAAAEAAAGGEEKRPAACLTTPTDIFKQLQPKTCKVVTEYGEGTGYFVCPEAGILMSSFHLVGSVMTKPLPTTMTPEFLAILRLKGYITQNSSSSEWLLTDKVRTLMHPKELEMREVDRLKNCGLTLTVDGVEYTKEALFTFVSSWLSKQPDSIDSQTYTHLKRAYFDRHISLIDSTNPIEIHMDGEIFCGKVHLPDGNEDRLVNFARHDTTLIKLTHFPDGRPFPDPAYVADFGEPILELEPEVRPEVGETVYYAGYPLGHEELLFSKGMVSCVSASTHKENIVLEAPIAPGNSGGPVFVVRDGTLFFVGLISSEVAQVSEKIRAISDRLKNYSGVSMLSGGINLTKSQNLLGVNLTETVLGNLSTGKGNAIRVTLVDLISDIRDLEIVRRDIFREVPQFFVPRRIKTHPPEPIRLFEFIIGRNILRLHVSDLQLFLNNHADASTKMCAKHFFSNLRQDDHINFSCYEHVWPGADMPSSDRTFDQMVIIDRSNEYDRNQAKASLKGLYDFAVEVGLGHIKSGQHIHGSTEPPAGMSSLFITRKSMLAEKFFRDHMCGQNNRQNKALADSVAARRGGRITVSTTLAEALEPELGKEVRSLQGFYSFVSQCMQEIAKTGGRGEVRGIFYLTLSDYPMQIRSSKAGMPNHTRSSFFYSTKQSSDDRHYMYHFAGTEPKTRWQLFDGSTYPDFPEGATTKVFYHH